MQEMRMLDELPRGTLEGGIERANELIWNITYDQHEGRWWVWGGDQVIFVTDTRASLEAFLYGFGLAYSVLPDHIFQQLKKAIADWAD